jgi:hypothetical protein
VQLDKLILSELMQRAMRSAMKLRTVSVDPVGPVHTSGAMCSATGDAKGERTEREKREQNCYSTPSWRSRPVRRNAAVMKSTLRAVRKRSSRLEERGEVGFAGAMQRGGFVGRGKPAEGCQTARGAEKRTD